jgi:hypothetical protein
LQATALEGFLNGSANLVNEFSDIYSIQDAGGSNTLVSPVSEIAMEAPLASLNGGRGLQGGGILVSGRNGVTSYVNLNGATTVDGIANAINAQTAGRQTALWNDAAKTFRFRTTTSAPAISVSTATGPDVVPLLRSTAARH